MVRFLMVQKLFKPESTEKPDIYALLNQALSEYEQFENLPFDKLMQSIVNFKARETRRDKKK